MPYGYGSHSDANDDVLQGQMSDAERMRRGYLGDSEHISAEGENHSGGPDWQPEDGAGAGYDVINGWKQAGTNAFDKDVDRYRQMGADGQNRAAVTIDQEQANESRALQMNALGLLRAQGDGTAASSAETLSQRANQGAVQNAGAAVTATRGGIGAHIAAQRTAGTQAAGSMLAGNAANADARAGEVSRGQGAYSTGATGVRTQDIGVATADAQLEAQQRALNEQRQQQYERLGWDTRKTQQQAADDYKRMSDDQRDAINRQRLAENARDDAQTTQAINTGLTVGQSVIPPAGKTSGSDERMKQHISPLQMGSLAHLRQHGRGQR